MTDGNGKKKRFEMVESENLRALVHGNVEVATIAKELGRNTSTIHKWLNDDQMPKDASLACEALRHRFSSDRNQFLLVRGPSGKMGELKPVLEAFGFEYKEMGGPF